MSAQPETQTEYRYEINLADKNSDMTETVVLCEETPYTSIEDAYARLATLQGLDCENPVITQWKQVR